MLSFFDWNISKLINVHWGVSTILGHKNLNSKSATHPEMGGASMVDVEYDNVDYFRVVSVLLCIP